MAWPQAPQPAPAPHQAAAGSTLPLGPLITAAAGVLTFLFSFVQIVKADSDFIDIGWSVWTTQPGFFGVGTWIPLFALVAGAAALARAFAPALADKEIAGFGLLQVQLAAAVFAVLLWLGYVVSVLLADDTSLGLGALLLFLGLAGLIAGTVLSLSDQKKGTTTSIGSGPPSGQWPAPGGPQPHSAPPSGQWPQPTPPPQPQYPQPGPGAPPPGAPSWNPGAPAAPGQWQPDPGAAPPPPSYAPPAPGQGGPPPAAAPGGGGLYDPGTQVIPGPPPAPPTDDPGHVGGGPDALPPLPPPNTP